MLITLAEIFTLVWQGLGAPEGENVALQVQRAVNEVMALKWIDLRQSNQNQYVNTTAEVPFVANQFIYQVDTLINVTPIIPNWVEIHYPPQQGTEFTWKVATVCNRDALQNFRDRGETACSFYSLPEHDTATTADFIEWSYDPPFTGAAGFRIWYNPEVPINILQSDTTGFPPSLNYYIAILARIKVIPVFIRQIIEDAELNDRDKDFVKMKVASWNQMLGEAKEERIEWEPKWKHYKNTARGQQPDRKKRKIIPYYL